MMQAPANGIRGPSTVQVGATLEVEVGGGATSVQVGALGSPDRKSYTVGPDRKVRIPTAGWTAGAMLVVATGAVGRGETLIVEVIDPD